MTQDERDGLWYPDSVVPDEFAQDHVLMKRAMEKADASKAILAAEPGYVEMARNFGLRVAGAMTWGRDVIAIPRFDRRRHDGKLHRIGRESIVSALECQNGGT